jgi:hypothetical protein
MGGDNLLITNGDVVQPYIGEDAATGLIALHGLSPAAQEEISVSHWRYGEKIVGGSFLVFIIGHGFLMHIIWNCPNNVLTKNLI